MAELESEDFAFPPIDLSDPEDAQVKLNLLIEFLQATQRDLVIAAESGGGASGGEGNPIMYQHDAVVSEDYTLEAGQNAISGGPLRITAGTVITIKAGAAWSIV